MFLGVTVDMINPQFTLFDWGWEDRGVGGGGFGGGGGGGGICSHQNVSLAF